MVSTFYVKELSVSVQNSGNKNAANWPSAPKKRGGKVKDIAKGEWTLHNLIEVSVFLGLIPKERADTFDQVIRD